MREVEIKFKRPSAKKLADYGFEEELGALVYRVSLLGGQMTMSVRVIGNSTQTEVIDNDSGEEYVLHAVSGAVGAFVGAVREEYESVLLDIVEACYEREIFKSEEAKEIIEYISSKYGDSLEYLWQKFPDNAVMRRKDTKKWYGAILSVSKDKLGLNGKEKVEIIDLRAPAEKISEFVDGVKYLPGYHMNKKHWYTVVLDGSVGMEELKQRIDASYLLAK